MSSSDLVATRHFQRSAKAQREYASSRLADAEEAVQTAKLTLDSAAEKENVANQNHVMAKANLDSAQAVYESTAKAKESASSEHKLAADNMKNAEEKRAAALSHLKKCEEDEEKAKRLHREAEERNDVIVLSDDSDDDGGGGAKNASRKRKAGTLIDRGSVAESINTETPREISEIIVGGSGNEEIDGTYKRDTVLFDRVAFAKQGHNAYHIYHKDGYWHVGSVGSRPGHSRTSSLYRTLNSSDAVLPPTIGWRDNSVGSPLVGMKLTLSSVTG